MHAFLGLVGLVFYISCVVVLAAGVTWLVVRLTPPAKPPAADDTAKTAG